jgi:SAM-dependent methyltransferase
MPSIMPHTVVLWRNPDYMNTIERIIPDELIEGTIQDQESLKLHVDRYDFAAKQPLKGNILDLACGNGYGSMILATKVHAAEFIMAIDISEEAIAYAKDRYQHPKIRFHCGDAFQISFAQEFDAIVSLETIEHVIDPHAFTKRLASCLKPGALFIVSAPVSFTTDVNPYHLTDFSRESFRALFKGLGLTEIDSYEQVQKVYVREMLTRTRGQRVSSVRPGLLRYYLLNPEDILRRLRAILTDGFNINYLTLVLKKSG